MSRRPALLLLGLLTLSACTPEAPTTPTITPVPPERTSLRRLPMIGQGNCGELDSYPFTTASGAVAGRVTTWWDDYSIHGAFEATPGYRFTRTTFGVVEWINIPYGIPFGPNGRVDFERFILQSRDAPPVERVMHQVPMDLINDMLMVYSILPRAVLRREGKTLPPMWAGGEIPWPDEIPWHSDTSARYATTYMIPNCRPRIVVLTDLNMFDNAGYPGNLGLGYQLIWAFEDLPAKYRYDNTGGAVLFDRGRDSPCWRDGSCGDSALSTLRNTYSNIPGVSVAPDIFSTSATLTSVPSGVKLLFLWLPREVFSVAEINALKQFVAGEGRIVFVTDRADYYGPAGRRTLNQFLADMGSDAMAAPGAFDCGDYRDVSLAGESPHRLTVGVSSVRVRCTGALAPGLRDFILFHDASGEHVTGASVGVDTTPIVGHRKAAP